MKGIPVYKEINDGHNAVGSGLRTSNPLFHCFDMADANDLKVQEMPPYRTDFFVLIASFGTKEFRYTLNETVFENAENFLLCVAPGQISNFAKYGDWFGFSTFFKSEFIRYNSEINFLEDYPFFNIRETNLFPLNKLEFENLSQVYQQILAEQENKDLYNTDINRALFQAILWQVRRIYEGFQKQQTDKTNVVIASKFQYLVNKNFTEKTLVEEYADMLNITPNHLSQTIKEATGKTAKSIITKNRLEEAKYLLRYTNNDVAEISFHLSFSEPTHFTKFFKKETEYTPLQYRHIHRAVSI